MKAKSGRLHFGPAHSNTAKMSGLGHNRRFTPLLSRQFRKQFSNRLRPNAALPVLREGHAPEQERGRSNLSASRRAAARGHCAPMAVGGLRESCRRIGISPWGLTKRVAPDAESRNVRRLGEKILFGHAGIQR